MLTVFQAILQDQKVPMFHKYVWQMDVGKYDPFQTPRCQCIWHFLQCNSDIVHDLPTLQDQDIQQDNLFKNGSKIFCEEITQIVTQCNKIEKKYSPGTGKKSVRYKYNTNNINITIHCPIQALTSLIHHHQGTSLVSEFSLGNSSEAITACMIPTIKYVIPNLCNTPGILMVLKSLLPPMLLMIRPKLNRITDLRMIFRTMVDLGLEFLSCDCIDMTKETPIIHINQGKTKSATVRPFHLALQKIIM